MTKTLEAKSAPRTEELFGDDHSEILRQAVGLVEVLQHLQYEGKASLGKNLREARDIVQYFDHEVMEHMQKEEEILFPFLASHLPKLEPLISLLRSEHADFRNSLRQFAAWLEDLAEAGDGTDRHHLIEKLKEVGSYLMYLLQGHHNEESEILYKVADRELRAEEKNRLAKQLYRTGIFMKRRKTDET